MPTLIRQGAIVEDDWRIITELDADAPLPEGKLIVPLPTWTSRVAELTQREAVGVWLDSHEPPEGLMNDLDSLAVIAINFPAFTDGRGYSYARLLRDRYGYRGEIRAIGEVLRDQLFFMQRCGFDAFALRDDLDAQAALAAFSDFSDSYQAASDQTLPLFRRR